MEYPEGSSLIRLASLTKTWAGSSGGITTPLDSFSFDFKEGETYAIVGRNGCGKTTLLDVIADLTKPDSGQVEFGISNPRISYIFQNFRESLLPWLSVEENITWPTRFSNAPKPKPGHVDKVLEFVSSRIPLKRRVMSLSGGQAQLVSIARAWAFDPAILLADEPFSAVDLAARRNLSSLLTGIVESAKMTSIVISHNAEDAVFVANNILIVDGPPLKVVDHIKIDAGLPRGDSFARSVVFAESVSRIIDRVVETVE